MELRNLRSTLSPLLKTSILGGLVVLASLLFYQSILYNNPVTTQDIQLLVGAAYVVLALVLFGVSVVLMGVTRHFIRRSPSDRTFDSSLTRILLSLTLKDSRASRAFVLASLLYGIFFAFTSGFLVYQPVVRFSETNGVRVPSILPVICCGPLGQMPQFVIYLTEHFAILVVPVNLILLVTVSWLVGLNVAIATYSYENRTNYGVRWIGGLGAIVGIFTACPTCAGFFLLTMLGLAGAVTFALTLSSLQIVFLGLGLPMLLLTPMTTARRSRNGQTISCAVSSHKETVDHQGS